MASKSSKSRSDTAVQGTNDSSIVSKCSTVKCGYFSDPYLKHFVAKEMRRAPLINRGYYVRAKAVEFTMKHFMDLNGSKKNQIVSVGCGFDSGYFRLKDQGLLENSTYIEVDFRDVATRKKHLIEDRPTLRDMLGNYSEENKCEEIVIDTGDYKLLGVDLTMLVLLEKTLETANVDFTIPTLFLSEVAITYMPHKGATRLLYWAAHTFENAAFMMYEQIIPYDAFGQFMQRHYKLIGSTLKCINKFETIDAQINRFKQQAHFNNLGSVLKSINTHPNPSCHKQRCIKQGWTDAFAVDINNFYRDFLTAEEHQRVERLEPFDEYEELSLKCSHYFMCVATRGSCCDMLINMSNSATAAGEKKEDESVQQTKEDPVMFSSLTNCAEIDKTNPYLRSIDQDSSNHGNKVKSIQVIGHAVCRLDNDTAVVTGGFGEVQKKHTRWQHIVVYDINSGTMEVAIPQNKTGDMDDTGISSTERMYHTATCVDGKGIILIGGRKSPTRPCDTVCLLKVDKFRSDQTGEDSNWTSSVEQIEVSGDKPAPCWRHTATRIISEGVDHVLLYGGRNEKDLILDQCFLLNTETWSWKRVESTGAAPGPRHSHSAVLHGNCVVISGGLDQRLRPVNTIHMLDVNTWMWTEVNIPNLLPRFSHSSLTVAGDLVLVGGVGEECPPPGCAIINLSEQSCTEKPLPLYKEIGAHSDPVIMLHNLDALLRQPDHHGSREVVILGGGGNCFSFGTHLNNTPLLLTL